MKKNTLAKMAAPAATPPKPNKAAINAIIKKLIDQRNIFTVLIDLKNHAICHYMIKYYATGKSA